MFYDNISQAVRDGLIAQDQIEEWLHLAYGPNETDEKQEKRFRTIRPDGSLELFQVVGLHRMARDAAALDAVKAEPVDTSTPVPEELLKDVPEAVYDTPLPDTAGDIKRQFGIISAVRRFGKVQHHIRDTRREGVMIRCPFPSHEDLTPSAWVNTDKNVWHCGKCQVGGDVIDFYAARNGLPVPEYHTSGEFRNLVTQMAEEIGIHNPAAWPSPLPDPPEEEVAPALREGEPEPELQDGDHVLLVNHPGVPDQVLTVDKTIEGIAFAPGDLVDDEEIDSELDPAKPIPALDWRSLPINPDSFLAEWMKFAGEYTPWVPEEYFLFAGFQAVGMACGNSLTSFTGAPLSGGTMVALIGPSGYGKSTAVGQLRRMLQRVPIVKFDRDIGSGVKIIPSPGSAEALVSSIRTEIDDPAAVVLGTKMEVGVTAWLYEDELATIVEKSRRRGGGAMKTRLIQLSDFVKSRWPDKEIVIEDFSLSGGTRVLHDCAFSATFTTQTDSIRSMMDKSDLVSGFLNRIVPVMGVQRVRRTISDMLTPPAVPDFDLLYEELWRWCRDKVRTIPFTMDALKLVDTHSFMKHAVDLGNRDSLFARLYHMTVRLAMLMAVNNQEDHVTPKYVQAACDIGSKYLVNCFAQLRSAVISTEEDECAERIVDFVRRIYFETGEWPDTLRWHKDRSYKDFGSAERAKALESLRAEGRICQIKISEGTRKKKVFLIPDNEWSGWADSDGRLYKQEDVYPKERVDA